MIVNETGARGGASGNGADKMNGRRAGGTSGGDADGMSGGGDWVYSEVVKDHFLHPRNFLMGDESKFDYDAVGVVGNPVCGDQMRMYIKVSDGRITDIRWKTYGCASAIASTSALSELAKGRTLEEAVAISAKDIDDFLGNLPKHKFHCSVLGHNALKEAVENYLKK